MSNRAEGPIFALINMSIMKQVILVLAEIFRANAMCGVVVLAHSILKVKLASSSLLCLVLVDAPRLFCALNAVRFGGDQTTQFSGEGGKSIVHAH